MHFHDYYVGVRKIMELAVILCNVYIYIHTASKVIGSSTTTHEEVVNPMVKPKKGQEVVCPVCQCVCVRVCVRVHLCTCALRERCSIGLRGYLLLDFTLHLKSKRQNSVTKDNGNLSRKKAR